jgi:hypothetical protein
MKTKASIVLSSSVLIVAAGIVLTMATGFWTTESNKIPKRLSISKVEYDSAATSGDLSGLPEYDPSDIRGSYTFAEIGNLYKIPLEVLAEAFMVEESRAAAFKCKDLGTHFEGAGVEIGTASMRMFVSFYYGLTYSSTEEPFLPASAAAILDSGTGMTEEQRSYLSEHTVEVTAVP